jgi:ribosomal protein S18 acetylase RimI-like enzyme
LIAGSVYVEERGPGLGYFGMLAVDPARQRRGLGRRLVDAAEAWARERGHGEMELQVVSARRELPPWYCKLGYREVGRRPFLLEARKKVPFDLIVMRKPLG